MPLTENLTQLLARTERELGKGKWVDLGSDLQRLPAARELLKKSKRKLESGSRIQWSIVEAYNDSASGADPYEPDAVNRVQTGLTAVIDWRHAKSSFTISHQEIAMNRNPARILDMVKEEKFKERSGMAEYLESRFWGCPADPTTSEDFFGIEYYCYTQPQSTAGSYSGAFATTGAFMNLNKTGVTSGAAGISSVTTPRWGNWNCQYTNATKDDLLDKMSRGAYETGFLSAVDHPDYDDMGNNRAIYSGYTVYASVKREVERQNDSLGNDLDSKNGKVLFQGNPWHAVPWIQQNRSSTSPVFQLDWNTISFVCLEGFYMKETSFEHMPGYHNLYGHFTDITCNLQVRNRRKLAVYSTA